MAGREPHQPGDLGHPGGAHAEVRQHAGRERGAALLVVGGLRVVHRVVEPGGQPYRVGVVHERLVFVHCGQYRAQVRDGVVPPVRLGPAQHEVGADPVGDGRVHPGRQRGTPAGGQVEHGIDASTDRMRTP